MTFEITETYPVSDYRDNNTWTCNKCGFSTSYDSDGDAPCECPTCLGREYEAEADAEAEAERDATQEELNANTKPNPKSDTAATQTSTTCCATAEEKLKKFDKHKYDYLKEEAKQERESDTQAKKVPGIHKTCPECKERNTETYENLKGDTLIRCHNCNKEAPQ